MEEDYQVRTERQELRAKEKALEQGVAICKQIARRPDLGPVSEIPLYLPILCASRSRLLFLTNA